MHGIVFRNRPSAKRAFTLVELLCVLSIIALLVALLLPALNKSRSQATVAVCKSYLHGYGMAGQMYLDENNGHFPNKVEEWLYTKASDSEAHPIGCRWHDWRMADEGDIMIEFPEYQGLMWAYINPSRLGPCPTFRRYAELRGCENPNHNDALDIKPQLSYSINGYLGTEAVGGVLREDQVRDPSSVFYFAEENSWSLRPDHPLFPATWLDEPLSTKALDDTVLMIRAGGEAENCFGTYHMDSSKDINRGYGHVVFIDGHVDTILADEQVRTARSYRRRGKNKLHGGNLDWAWASKADPPVPKDKKR